MESKNWSSSLVRMLVLIAGLLVILETVHVLSISVTLHTPVTLQSLGLDVRNIHNVPGIAVGFLVGMLALIPSRRNRPRKVRGVVTRPWRSINSVESVNYLMLVAYTAANRSEIR